MSTLKSSLEALAASFAAEVVRSIQKTSLQELLGEVAETRARRNQDSSSSTRLHETSVADETLAPRAPMSAVLRTGRLRRRSADDIAATLGRIVTLLKQNPAGLRAEEIRKQLDLLAKEMPRPLAEGLSASVLRKKGQKRATVYFSAGGGASGVGETLKAARKK